MLKLWRKLRWWLKRLFKRIVERPTESVQEAADLDCVMSEETRKDEILDSTKIPDSVTQVIEMVAKEGLAGKDETQDGVQENAEVDQMNKEESSQSTIEVRTHDAPISEKETDSNFLRWAMNLKSIRVHLQQ